MDYFANGLLCEPDYALQRELSNREKDRIWKHIDRRRLALRVKMINHIKRRRADINTEDAKRMRFVLRNLDCPATARVVWNQFHPDCQIEEPKDL